MGIIRLSLVTVGALGVAMLQFGKDEGLPDDRIGREPTIVQDTIEMVSADGDVPQTNSAAQGEVIATANAVPAPQLTAARLTATPVSIAATAAPETAAERAEAAARAMANGSPQITLASAEVEISGDMAEAAVIFVSGSRVNMRSGPATSFGVVDSLTRGTAVVDMGDAGNGWNQIKVVDTGERGFMSSKFLTPNL